MLSNSANASQLADSSGETNVWMQRLLFIAGILVLIIGLPLFLLPTKTALLFSWTVNPPITASFLGGAYLAAFVIEMTSSRETAWSRSRLAVPAVLLFTTMTLIATLMHIDKFHFGAEFHPLTRFITYVWLLVYAAVPVVMATLLFVQIRQAGKDPIRSAPMAHWGLYFFGVQALVLFSLGIALFCFPNAVKETFWPWALSPLTARTIGAWLLGIGLLLAHIVRERDYLRVENALLALSVGSILELFSLWRLADDQISGVDVINWQETAIWIYAAFLFSIFSVSFLGWLVARKKGSLA